MVNSETSRGTVKDDYRIHLNFLPVEIGAAPIFIYRRQCTSPQEQRPSPHATAHKLPSSLRDQEDWKAFWVLSEATEGFEAFEFQSVWNADLARRIVFRGLKVGCFSAETNEYRFPDNSFIQEVSLIMETHPEGEELLIVQPYSLKALRQTGFLVDFHFRLDTKFPSIAKFNSSV